MQVRTQRVHYDVTGTTAGELYSAMRAYGPVHDGRRVYGHHAWDIRWTFRYAASSGACRMRDVRVELTSTTTLPRWSPPADASDSLVAQWTTFRAALEAHEHGHARIGADAAREIHRSLRGHQQVYCGSMAAQANALAQQILARYREQNRRYDQQTGAGASQGAVWPPRSMLSDVPGAPPDSVPRP
jgi:predicted secreted Zn-dependent protease